MVFLWVVISNRLSALPKLLMAYAGLLVFSVAVRRPLRD